MSWELLALLAALMYGMQSIMFRHIMKKGNNVAYTWIFNMLSAAMFFFLAVGSMKIPYDFYPWLLVLVAGVLWIADNLVGFEAWKHLEVSLKAPISKIALVFILILSALFLNETITLQKISGIAIIILGVIVLTWEGRFFAKLNDKGVKLAILTEIIFSIVVIVDKITVSYFTPLFYGFLVYFIPAILLTPFAIRNTHVRKLMSKKLILVITAALGVIGYAAQLTAYTMTDVSNLIPIIELSVIIAVLGGFLFHKEKNIKLRLLGAVIMLLGSVLIMKPGLL